MYQSNEIQYTPDAKISEIILNNPYLLLFLEHFRISLPVQDKTLRLICMESGLSTTLVLKLVNLYSGFPFTPYTELSFDDTKGLIFYLRNSHHFYLNEIYPEILGIIEKMSKVNDSREMSLVKTFFIDYFKEVTDHLDYEENVVFPYVLGLYDRIKQAPVTEKEKHYSVEEYREHHNDIEEKLDDLKSLLIKYLPEKTDKQLRRKLLLSLFELEYDLNVHAQIEELILVPVVKRMELYLKKE